MSILIRDMEMPTSCDNCPLCGCFVLDDGTEENYRCCATMRVLKKFDKREEHCPLIELPPHGDLIERKAAYDSILEGMVMTGYQSRALDCISEFYVPTIIKVEEAVT